MSENKNFFRASAEDFKKIPGSPVAYWVGDGMQKAFETGQHFPGDTKKGVLTGDNDKYLRIWSEVSNSRMGRNLSSHDGMVDSRKKWFPVTSGGEKRRWYGNLDTVVNLENDGADIKAHVKNYRLRDSQYYFREAITWTEVSSSIFSCRYVPHEVLFGNGGPVSFFFNEHLFYTLGLLNSKVAKEMFSYLAPTINFGPEQVEKIPVVFDNIGTVDLNVRKAVACASADWDAYETSWDFKLNPLVAERGRRNSDSPEASLTLRQDRESRNVSGASDESEFQLSALYSAVREKWAKSCEEMRRLETENNRIFIEAYGLQDELTPEVPWNEITLTCNPWYRYGAECGVQSAELPRDGKLEERLKGDTVKELISYAVGCMMGRYSLEKPGLVLADQGATLADYWEKVGRSNSDSSEATLTLRQTSEMRNVSGASDKSEFIFVPDDDGIIPILDNDWFADDIVTRFKEFVKVAFGEAHFFENMAWIEEALGKNLRDYFTKDFYKDHLQRYQNRPIYWLFQSPKGAFRALVYMHRYKPDMVGGVLGYLRSLQTKVENQLGVATQIASDESKSSTERVRANKEVVKYSKMQKELDEYEKHVLYPLSTERIEIDLDDGVKVNYKKFGVALRKVAALEGKGE